MPLGQIFIEIVFRLSLGSDRNIKHISVVEITDLSLHETLLSLLHLPNDDGFFFFYVETCCNRVFPKIDHSGSNCAYSHCLKE